MKGPTFIDRVTIRVTAGSGGKGCVAFRREKFEPHGGPFGGDGGNGGSVILQASKDANSLLDLYFQPLQQAEHGEPGRGKQQDGKNGCDLLVKVPCGTDARDAETGEWLGELLADGETLCVAHGGRGGLGNCHFTTPSHQAPREFTPGVEGEQRRILLELKTVAEVGLAGYPNAGKSTLIGALTPAHPKVGAYPFTTRYPVIGTLVFDDYATLRIADIPGLMDGAHRGVGLGHDFLRHIERTQLILLMIDMAGTDGRHPADDYANLVRELALYKAELADRPRWVMANKMDCPEAADRLREFTERTGIRPLEISARSGQGLPELKRRLRAHFHPPS